MITKARAKKCRDHCACDCQRYQLDQARKALAIIHAWAMVDGDYIEAWMKRPAIDRIMDADEVLARLRLIQRKAEEGLEKI